MLSWVTLHNSVAQVIAAGFSVTSPSDIAHAVKLAMEWGAAHRSALQMLTPNDFEPLAVATRRNGDLVWWESNPLALSVDDRWNPPRALQGFLGSPVQHILYVIAS